MDNRISHTEKLKFIGTDHSTLPQGFSKVFDPCATLLKILLPANCSVSH